MRSFPYRPSGPSTGSLNEIRELNPKYLNQPFIKAQESELRRNKPELSLIGDPIDSKRAAIRF
jgi:hypothetical protein